MAGWALICGLRWTGRFAWERRFLRLCIVLVFILGGVEVDVCQSTVKGQGSDYIRGMVEGLPRPSSGSLAPEWDLPESAVSIRSRAPPTRPPGGRPEVVTHRTRSRGDLGPGEAGSKIPGLVILFSLTAYDFPPSNSSSVLSSIDTGTNLKSNRYLILHYLILLQVAAFASE